MARLILVALLVAGCYVPAEPAEGLPEGAVLVYFNANDGTRVFRLSDCLFTESWKPAGYWILQGEPACGTAPR